MMSAENIGVLKNKVAIITGAAQGIGLAFASGMAKEGCQIVIADIDLEKAKLAVKTIEDLGGQAIAVRTNVSEEEHTLKMASVAKENFGRLDILINNAALVSRGSISRSPFHEIDLAEWDRVMEINIKGAFLCCRAVFPFMKDQKYGKIINLTSTQFYKPVMTYAHYIVSKAGIIGLTRALAMELGDYNINVNCIAPGSVLTQPASNNGQLQSRQEAASRQAIKRIEVPQDIVGTAIFLASSASDFVTGQTIVVDGGFVMH
jgi:3-oxoacyl-[acyl-carrier protein] reductase